MIEIWKLLHFLTCLLLRWFPFHTIRASGYLSIHPIDISNHVIDAKATTAPQPYRDRFLWRLFRLPINGINWNPVSPCWHIPLEGHPPNITRLTAHSKCFHVIFYNPKNWILGNWGLRQYFSFLNHCSQRCTIQGIFGGSRRATSQ